ncbi:hypothetical protein [Phytohabitans kaempferiae]|uniref:Uncharacterized protein n=1 Tax=Phytohabitans kaempferiae TaxID=1620943 RepID=A0ABV6MF91_9ACTN
MTDIHDYIERWHDAPPESVEASMELHDFLGMSWDEYRLWGEQPSSLRFILAARRAEQSVSEVLRQAKTVGAAARSRDSSDAERVLSWLAKRGQIEASQRNL